MATLFFLIFIFAVCKGISAAAHAPRRQRSRASATPQAVQRSSGPAFTPAATLATLDALQQQRDSIRKQLQLIESQLKTLQLQHEHVLNLAAAGDENAINQYMRLQDKRQQIENKRIAALSKLAACESKIGKITGF